MAVDFSSFRENLDQKQIDQLNKDYASNSNFEELPNGTYHVELDKMELRTTNWGTDQIGISFKIVEGEKKGRLIFYNGTFNKKIDSGFRATARLISQLTGYDVDENSILFNITKEDHQAVSDYITDLLQALHGAYQYDVSWEVVEQTDINPNTGKPWAPNRFLKVVEDDQGLCIFDK